MRNKYIKKEACFKCDQYVDRSEEDLEMNTVDINYDVTAYCKSCHNKIISKYSVNPITILICKRWVFINRFVEAFLELLRKRSSETTFTGQLKDGKPHGTGVYRSINYKYVGEFEDGKFNGHGELSYSDGRRYIGKWRYGKPYGKGLIVSEDGSETAVEYCSNGDIYQYGDHKIWGIHKALWFLMMALFVLLLIIFIILSISVSDSLFFGIFLVIISVASIIFLIYVLCHMLAFIVLVFLELISRLNLR